MVAAIEKRNNYQTNSASSENNDGGDGGQIRKVKPTGGLEKIEEETDQDDPNIDWSTRRKVFVLFVLGNLFLNYDTGVIPACLLQIEKDLKLGY